MLNPDESISAGHSLAQGKDVNVQSISEHAGWRCTDEYVAASDVVAAPIEMIGTFVVPAPAGRASRDFQTLHFDFGVPLVPFAAADVARLTALHVPAWVSSAQALTRFVGLRPLLSGHTCPGLGELVRRFVAYGASHGAWQPGTGFAEGSLAGFSKRRSASRRPCPCQCQSRLPVRHRTLHHR